MFILQARMTPEDPVRAPAIRSQVRECEEDFSAEQAEAQEDPRFQGAHEYARGAGCAEAQALEGPEATVCVTRVDRPRGRLTRSDDFVRVYRAGRSVANRYLVLYYFERSGAEPTGGAEGPRVGFSVSKRLGGAVERNSVKRVLREAFRSCSESLRGGMDLVFVARTPIVEVLEAGGLEAVKEKMVEVLSKAPLSGPREERRPTQ
jgi:ribonuclease P protein component